MWMLFECLSVTLPTRNRGLRWLSVGERKLGGPQVATDDCRKHRARERSALGQKRVQRDTLVM